MLEREPTRPQKGTCQIPDSHDHFVHLSTLSASSFAASHQNPLVLVAQSTRTPPLVLVAPTTSP